MATSSAIVWRRNLSNVDNSGTGAGTQWLNVLYEIYHYFFTTANAIDSGRWELIDSNLTALQWGTLGNVVDNSWFVVRAPQCRYGGTNPLLYKFQATNVAALDETPAGTYRLVVSMHNDATWHAKGAFNGGYTSGIPYLAYSGNKLVGGTNQNGNPDGSLIVVGDRETVLIASTLTGQDDYDCGAYLGRYLPDTDCITHPTCLLTAWDGVGNPKGFDRTAGGVFDENPGGSYCVNHNAVADVVKVWSPGWLTNVYQPSRFVTQWNYRELEITCTRSYLGKLRLVWAVGALASRSRFDSRQKLVLHGNAGYNDGVAVVHDGTSV